MALALSEAPTAGVVSGAQTCALCGDTEHPRARARDVLSEGRAGAGVTSTGGLPNLVTAGSPAVGKQHRDRPPRDAPCR